MGEKINSLQNNFPSFGIIYKKEEMQKLDKNDFDKMDKQYRVNFMNSVIGYRNVSLIGTQNLNEQTNLAIFSTTMHLGSNPALMGFISRPNHEERHTVTNIIENGYFTINAIDETFYPKAHQTSARYSKEQSEFDMVGLSKWYSGTLNAPYVEISPIKIGLKYLEQHTIFNGTILIVGEVQEIYLKDVLVENDGLVNLSSASIVSVHGNDCYSKLSKLDRLAYAKA